MILTSVIFIAFHFFYHLINKNKTCSNQSKFQIKIISHIMYIEYLKGTLKDEDL